MMLQDRPVDARYSSAARWKIGFAGVASNSSSVRPLMAPSPIADERLEVMIIIL